MSLSITEKFEFIEDVSRDVLAGANQYANATRTSQGTEKINAWITDVRALLHSRPFFRTVEGYDHTMFVLDIDTEVVNEKTIAKYYTEDELRRLKIKTAMKYFKQWQDDNGYDFMEYISGTGFYMIQRYEKPIPKEAMLSVLWDEKKDSIIPKCSKRKTHKSAKLTCDGWHIENNDLTRIVREDNVNVLLKIDLRMVNGLGARLFRVPYSPYYKLSQIYHCVPVIKHDDGSYDYDETFKCAVLHSLKIDYYKTPQFAFEWLLDSVDDITKTSRSRMPSRLNFKYKIDVPEPDDELSDSQQQTIEDMELLITGDVKDTPPCMKRNYLDPIDRHWSRVTLTRYFGAKGFTPSDVGTFIRFKVNNEDDNLPQNRPNLHKYTPLFFGDPKSPDMPPSCSKMQNSRSQFYACKEEDYSVCKRTYCLSSQVKQKPKKLMKVTREASTEGTDDKEQRKSFKEMGKKIQEVLSQPSKNFEIIKTTRAGVTTTLIKECFQAGKKLLAVSPTNAIGEKTFKNAMWLIKDLYDKDVNGALLTSNAKGCLKLVLDKQELENKKESNPDWGEEKLAYNKLKVHFKPSCITDESVCEYVDDLIELPNLDIKGIPLPIIGAEVEIFDNQNLYRSIGNCGYQTVIQNLENIDVLFITYDKLRALSIGEDDSIVSQIQSIFDVVFLDEISQFAQKNSSGITLYQLDDEKNMYSLVDELEDEISTMLSHNTTETLKKLISIIEIFKEEYKQIIVDWERAGKFTEEAWIERMDSPLDYNLHSYVNENFSSMYGVIERFAKDKNIHLKKVEEVLLLLLNDYWWVQNIPTYERTIDCSIATAPIVNFARQFIRPFDRSSTKQVIVTDATMPLIKMSELFGVDFVRFVIGDPRNTSDHQLVIADNRRIYPFRFFTGSRNNYLKDLIDTIKLICETHGSRNIMIVLPNSRKIYWFVRDAMIKKVIPSDLEITYYRSDKTVGVESDRRVQLVICAPYPPRGSYLWLASYYHEVGLHGDIGVVELSGILEKMNAHQTFYQTIGRAKSPDNSERSIVYTWGIDKATLDEIIQMDDDVSIPHITYLQYNNARNYILPHMAKLWLNHKIIVPPIIIRTAMYLQKHDDRKFTLNQLKRSLRLNSNDFKSLNTVNPIAFEHFGIFHYTDGKKVYLYSG